MHPPAYARQAALLSAILLAAGDAGAQVHWDVGAQAGVLQRFQSNQPAGAPSPIPGPVGEVHAHVAVVPMLRVGPYAAYDVSPLPSSAGVPARQFVEGGLRGKLAPPLLSGPWHTWAFLGLGYAWAFLPGYTVAGRPAGGIDGGILDLPAGVGVGYRLRGARDPWELTAELGARVGLAFFGPLYADGPHDSFALSLSVGVSLEP
jgi:hypothetical protein